MGLWHREDQQQLRDTSYTNVIPAVKQRKYFQLNLIRSKNRDYCHDWGVTSGPGTPHQVWSNPRGAREKTERRASGMCRPEASVTVWCLISDGPSPVSLFRHVTIRKIGRGLSHCQVSGHKWKWALQLSSMSLVSWHPSLWFNTPDCGELNISI